MRRDLGDGYELDDDPARIDLVAVHRFLSEESYWAAGRDYEMQEELVRGAARVVGVYRAGEQVGFCRAASTPAMYLADVYILPGHRGRGLGEAMVEEMVENGPYAERTWLLHTADAHALYRKFGFAEPGERVMERPPKEPRPRP
jgi:ribosomal protein S18 acetylase RimI-like enzyme